MQQSIQPIFDSLKLAGQHHVLQFVDQLDSDQQQRLLQQISEVDFQLIQQLFSQQAPSVGSEVDPTTFQPPVALRLNDPATVTGFTREQAIDAGEQAIRSGEVAALIVAGGQGTRLGFDQPKGMFPIGPISHRTLFQFVADKIRNLQRYYGSRVPLLVMTSPSVHEDTVHYFREHDNFGITDSLHFFCQNTMPSVDAQTGKVLLETTGKLSLSPNGHGGMLDALNRSGLLDRCLGDGIESFFFGQIDNPLSPTCCPELLGFHKLTAANVSLQTIAKESAEDQTGNIIQIAGQTQIIEYSEIPSDIAQQTSSDGTLRFWAANIAVHIFQADFLRQMAADPDVLPFHKAYKTVPHLDALGNQVQPAAPNAMKFEKFIFDLLPHSNQTTVIEAKRSHVFAPVKNHEKAGYHTAATSKQAISDLHRRWLQQAGVQVADDVLIEIDPSWALNPQEVAQHAELPKAVTADTFFTSS